MWDIHVLIQIIDNWEISEILREIMNWKNGETLSTGKKNILDVYFGYLSWIFTSKENRNQFLFRGEKAYWRCADYVENCLPFVNIKEKFLEGNLNGFHFGNYAISY